MLELKRSTERISDGNKTQLEDSGWLKKREPDSARRRWFIFMDWLKKKHASGEPHNHRNPGSPDAEKAFQQSRDHESGNPVPQ